MGHQQLLMIVLGVIVIGIAVALGIQNFQNGAEENVKDEIGSYSLTIGVNAQQFYKKPISLGGGGNSFIGFSDFYNTKLSNLHNSQNASYSPGSETASGVTITGTPESSLQYAWTMVTRVTRDSINTTLVN